MKTMTSGPPSAAPGLRENAGDDAGQLPAGPDAERIPSEAQPPVDKLLRMYRQMLAIRLFEERVNDLYTRALMPGLAHLYIGEEAVAVGICEALRGDDYITSTHRGH